MIDNMSSTNDLDSCLGSKEARVDHFTCNIDPEPQNGNGLNESPTAPSPGLVLFNSEEQSDLIFIVTMDSEEDSLKFPGHSFIIKDSSPIFKDIVHQIDQRQRSPTDAKPIINIQCRPETLHNLMSYIYKKEVVLNSVTHCLALLELSIKFMLTELTGICLTFLCNNVTEFNVLLVLISLSKIDFKPFRSTSSSATSQRRANPNSPSNNLTADGRAIEPNPDNNDSPRPRSKAVRSSSITSVICLSSEDSQPLSQFTLDQHKVHQYNYQLNESNELVQNLVNELISRCYCILDESAESILSSEAICTLDRVLLVKILSRDTLKLVSELTAFQAVERWSVCQCQRQLTEINGLNKMAVLGDAIFSVRYLTMPLMVFMRGPFASDILSEMDKNYLQSKLLDPDTRLPPHLTGLKLDVKRKWVKPNSVTSGNKSSVLRSYNLSSSSNPRKPRSISTPTSSSPPSSTSPDSGCDRKKKRPIKKFLNGLGDVMIFAIRIFD